MKNGLIFYSSSENQKLPEAFQRNYQKVIFLDFTLEPVPEVPGSFSEALLEVDGKKKKRPLKYT